MKKLGQLIIITSTLIILSLLTSCDGGDEAYIINNSEDTITITLKQTLKEYSNYNNQDTTQKTRPLELKVYKSTDKDEFKHLGDYEIKFDSAHNSATFKLLPNDILELGSTWLSSREEYRNWEFNEIEASFKDGKIFAKDDGIPKIATRKKSWFGYPKYYITFGHK